jgi:predicted aldo/keto reductase-like oxidoreductase
MAKKLGFGCMRLPLLDEKNRSSFDEEQVKEMADYFIENGFTYFDTAYMYHDYESENMVRRAVVERHPREAFTVADKLPVMQLKEKADHERIFQEQLSKVGVDYFDYYLLHSMNGSRIELLDKLGTWDFVEGKKKEGKVRNLGFSFHDDAETLDRILTEHPDFDFVQLQINYLDWDNRTIQSGRNYEVARKHGKKIVVMEPVKGGQLAKLPEEAMKILHKVSPDMSAASWAVRFAASLDGVMMVLSGMSTIGQMKDNTSYMKDFKALTDEEKDALEDVVRIVKAEKTIPCTACRYCVEGCPKHIAIPEYFALHNHEISPEKDSDFAYNNAQDRYDELAETHGKAGDCIECKRCEKSCPQMIKITDELKKIAEEFEED